MVIQKKTPNLMALLDSHAKEATPEVLIILKPLNPLPPRPSPPEPAKKKRKREKRPGKKVSEEAEIQGQPLQEQAKGSSPPRANKRGLLAKALALRWPLNTDPESSLGQIRLPFDSSIRDFNHGRAVYVADAMK